MWSCTNTTLDVYHLVCSKGRRSAQDRLQVTAAIMALGQRSSLVEPAGSATGAPSVQDLTAQRDGPTTQGVLPSVSTSTTARPPPTRNGSDCAQAWPPAGRANPLVVDHIRPAGPFATRMASSRTSLPDVEVLDAASAEFEHVVRQLPEDSWQLPTPSDVSVRELVEHVVVGNRLTALLLAGVDRDEARAALNGDQLSDDPIAAVVESAQRQAQAFATTPLEQAVVGPNGIVPAAAYLRFRLVDLVVHAWDLLRATRLDNTIDPRLVIDVMDLVEPHLNDKLAFGAYGAGPSGTLAADASSQNQLLDWFGRRP